MDITARKAISISNFDPQAKDAMTFQNGRAAFDEAGKPMFQANESVVFDPKRAVEENLFQAWVNLPLFGTILHGISMVQAIRDGESSKAFDSLGKALMATTGLATAKNGFDALHYALLSHSRKLP